MSDCVPNFRWAVGKMKNKFKVRRRIWNEKQYIFRTYHGFLNNEEFKTNSGSFAIEFEDFEAIDWEIFEEKPKRIFRSCLTNESKTIYIDMGCFTCLYEAIQEMNRMAGATQKGDLFIVNQEKIEGRFVNLNEVQVR